MADEGLPNLGKTCYVNAAIQAVKRIVEAVTPPASAGKDGPLLRAFRAFVDRKDPEFVRLLSETLGRDLNVMSDSAEFVQDMVEALALEDPAVEHAFQCTWTPSRAALCCDHCGHTEDVDPASVAAKAVKRYAVLVPPIPGKERVLLSEALTALEDTTSSYIVQCPKCNHVSIQ